MIQIEKMSVPLHLKFKSKSFILLLIIVIFTGFTVQSQNRLQYIFKLPSKLQNGSVDCHFTFDYKFEIQSIEEEEYIAIRMKVVGTPTTSGGEYRYRYKGIEYSHNVLAKEDGQAMTGFTSVVLKNADFMIYIQGEGYSTTARFEQVLGYKQLLKVKKDTDVSKFTLTVHSLEDIYITNAEVVEKRIESYLKLNKNRADYKNYIRNGDMDFNSKNWAKAKYSYEQALLLFPSETYPKSQLEKIKNEEAKTAAKSLSENPANTSTNTDPKNLSSTSDKSPANNTASTGNSSSTSDPEVIKSGDKYYKKNPNGLYSEISEDSYTKDQSDASNTTSDEQLAKNKETLTRMDEDFKNNIKESNERADRNRELMANSYYSAKAVDDAKSNLKDASHLDGNYKTVEELEADFNRKYASLNQNVQNVTDAKNAALQSSYEYQFRDGSESDKAIGKTAVMIGNMVNEAEAEKEKKRMRENLERERLANLKQIEEMKKQMMIEMRTTLLLQFPDGGVPLSSHKIDQNELYFFSYIFDPASKNSNAPNVYVTNVFPIGRYGDETWPFKKTIVEELSKQGGVGEVTLMGYYTTLQMAEEMRSSFRNLASKSGMKIVDITYKGKKTSASETTDFWGTGTTIKKETDLNKKQPEKKEVDFWEESGDRKEEKTTPAKKQEDNFWD